MLMVIGHLVSVPPSLLEASKSQEPHFFESLAPRYCWLKTVCCSDIRRICLRCGKKSLATDSHKWKIKYQTEQLSTALASSWGHFIEYMLSYIYNLPMFSYSQLVSKLQNWMKKKSWFIEFLRVKTMMCEKYLTSTGHSERLIHWDFSTCYLDRRWFLHGSKRRGNTEIIFAK